MPLGFIYRWQRQYNSTTEQPHKMTLPVLDKSAEFLTPIIAEWDFAQKPLILSVSGPQGSGKSFLSSKLMEHFRTNYPHLKAITISTDDMYLEHKEQVKVANEYPDNKLVQGRGLPGTHDVEMTFKVLTKLDNKETGFTIPTYDKSAFGGAGDRAPEEEWTKIDEPVDIVVLEGWFNGYTPIADGRDIEAVYNKSPRLQKYNLEDLYTLNAELDTYIKLWGFVNVDIFYDTDSVENVYTWRVEQEHELIDKKGTGMTDEQVRAFIDRYMVVYELYFKDFVDYGVSSLPKGKHLRMKLNLDRDIIETQIF